MTDVVKLSRFMKKLENQGFSAGVRGFISNAASVKKLTAPPHTRRIMDDVKSSVRQFQAGLTNIDEAASLIKSRNFTIGTAAGVAALGLVTGEVAFATYKTNDAYDSTAEAALTNAFRVVLATGAGFGAAKSNSLAGKALWGGASGTMIGVGGGSIALEQTGSDIANAKAAIDAELQNLLSQERIHQENLQAQRDEIRQSISDLTEQRDNMLAPPNSEGLRAERDQIASEISHLQEKITAMGTKPNTEAGQAFISAGFDHVGVNVDGIKNDEPYDSAVANLARLEERLIPIDNLLFERAKEAGTLENLTSAQRESYDQIESSISALNKSLLELQNDQNSAQLEKSIIAQREILANFTYDPTKATLLDDMSQVLNTKEGAYGAINGGIFSAMSVFSGTLLHLSADKLLDRGSNPALLAGDVQMFGIPLSSIGQDSYILKNHTELARHANLIKTDDVAMRSAVQEVASSHLDKYRAALIQAVDEGVIPAEKFDEVLKVLVNAEANIRKTLSGQDGTKIVKDLKVQPTVAETVVEVATEAADLDNLTHMKKTGALARLGGNIPAIGAGFAGAGLAMVATFALMQVAHAGELRDAGVISQEGYDAYVDMSTKVGVMQGGDATLSGLDPIGVTIPVTLVSEMQAKSMFEDWYHQYGVAMEQDSVDAMSKSLFETVSVREELVRSIGGYIPRNLEGYTGSVLEDVIKAKMDFVNAVEEDRHLVNSNYNMIINPERQEAARLINEQYWDRVHEARDHYHSTLAEVAVRPGGMRAYMSLFPKHHRLDLARELSASEGDHGAFSASHPDVSQFVADFNSRGIRSGLLGIDPKSDYLSGDELNTYIMQRMGYEKPGSTMVAEAAPKEDASDLQTSFQNGVLATAIAEQAMRPVTAGATAVLSYNH